jgi:hypothetical protein
MFQVPWPSTGISLPDGNNKRFMAPPHAKNPTIQQALCALKSEIEAEGLGRRCEAHTGPDSCPRLAVLFFATMPLTRPATACFVSIVLCACTVLAAVGCTVKDSHPVAVTPQVVPTELWVAPDGLDSNSGTAAAPLRSLARAAQLVTPGTTVNVLPGAYQGGFRTNVNGLPNARIVFRSTERWQARIVPPSVSGNDKAWENRASYIDIQGFEIDGAAHTAGRPWTTGIYSGGSYNRIAANHVHDIANHLPCNSKAGAGISIDSYYKGIFSEVAGNSVHDIGPPRCRYLQGIAVGTTGTVRNNIVYRVAEAGIRLWRDAYKVIVVNNTVTASNTGILVGGGDFHHTKGLNDHTHVFNNIVFDNRYGIAEQGATGKHNSYRNNLVFANKEADWHLAEGMRHTGTIAAAPAFVGYSRGGTPDFRLAAGSPAIGKGIENGADGPDFYGKTRGQRDAIDVGACQH